MIKKDRLKILEHKGEKYEIETRDALLIETLKDLINILNKLVRKNNA